MEEATAASEKCLCCRLEGGETEGFACRRLQGELDICFHHLVCA